MYAVVAVAVVLGIAAGALSIIRSAEITAATALDQSAAAFERIDELEQRLGVLEGKLHSRNAAHLGAELPSKRRSYKPQTVELPAKRESTTLEVSSETKGTKLSSSGSKSKPGVMVIVTTNGNRYMNWQTRVCYKSYQAQASKPGSHLKAFKRLLHRASDDELMVEVPTIRIPSAHPDCDVWCQYPVADRGPALLEFLSRPEAWEYEHLLIIETDHVFVDDLKIPLPAKGRGVAFPFGYINPTYPTVQPIMRRYYDGDLADIPGTGNAPVLLRVEDMVRLLPVWNEVTEKIDQDEEAVKVLGWVREMYAFSIASARVGIKYDMPRVPLNPLMVQPPADDVLGKAIICHYTWGTILKDKSTDSEVWRWDKREYANGQYGDKPVVPMLLIPPMPPYSASFVTQDGQAFSKGKYDLLQVMVLHFNTAVAALNEVNNGVPLGFNTLEEAAVASQPSKEAWEARQKIEAEEAAKRAEEAERKANETATKEH